jgi:hypothetical protein
MNGSSTVQWGERRGVSPPVWAYHRGADAAPLAPSNCHPVHPGKPLQPFPLMAGPY